ncbi:MAG: hypothetical protein DYH18_02450 [Xanthomonadales bacterium PRO7]|nr:hypothetical protein [Xanthomonadales bacterium PRO7]
MDPAAILVLVITGLVVWALNSAGAKASPVIKPDSFSQAGVVVNYAARTIAINGKTYPVNAVRGLSSAREYNRSVAYITMTDLEIPVHKINFNYHMEAAQAFIARLGAAIDRAGGPHFH